ncbi:MAG: TraR/DksA C4-type zinc finger protein [candidate division WOR-3 bacterium]
MNKPRKLTKAEILKFEKALLAEKQRILRQGAIAEKIMEACAPDATGDLSRHRTHTADQGTESYQRELASRLRSIESATLREIDDALRRISSGTYGACEKCGDHIPKARLEIVPHARFCMKCLRDTR